MCFKEILKSPDKAILKAKKSKSLQKTMRLLYLISAVIAVSSVLIVFNSFSSLVGIFDSNSVLLLSAGIGLIAFLAVIVVALLIGIIVRIVATTLGGRGSLFEGMTAIVYGLAAPSLGVLLASLLLFIPFGGIVIGFFVLAISLAMGISTFYRAIKELFGMDMLLTFITVSIIVTAIVISFYAVTILGVLSQVGSIINISALGGAVG